MKLNVNELQEKCKKILNVLDSNALMSNELLEIKDDACQGNAYLTVSNGEYKLQTFIPSPVQTVGEPDLRAVVSASVFFKLIAKITTEWIELSVNKNSLLIKGNGNYKIPLVYEGDTLANLPDIELHNVVSEFEVKSDTLQSIAKYNLKEAKKQNLQGDIHNYVYLDEKGAVTFSAGIIVVNKFNLDKQVKLLLREKIVRLFKLFGNDETLEFKLGFDEISGGLIQTKIVLKSGDVEVTAIIATDNGNSKVNRFPVTSAREKVEGEYPFTSVINKEVLLDTITRLKLLSQASNATSALNFSFGLTDIVIYDNEDENTGNKENYEVVNYASNTPKDEESSQILVDGRYNCILNVDDLVSVLSLGNEEFVTVKFGNKLSIVVSRPDVDIALAEME